MAGKTWSDRLSPGASVGDQQRTTFFSRRQEACEFTKGFDDRFKRAIDIEVVFLDVVDQGQVGSVMTKIMRMVSPEGLTITMVYQRDLSLS